MFPWWKVYIIRIHNSTFQQIKTKFALFLIPVHVHISLLTVCLPSSRCPAWTCHPARVWSPCGYMRGLPCCATSCPPASCGKCWPAAAPCRRCNGWWSDKTTTAGKKEQRGKKTGDVNTESQRLKINMFLHENDLWLSGYMADMKGLF